MLLFRVILNDSRNEGEQFCKNKSIYDKLLMAKSVD